MHSDPYEENRSSLAGDSHTATSALHILDITYGAEAERCVDDVKIMPPQPTKEPTDSRRYSWHVLTGPDTTYTLTRPRHTFLRLCSIGKVSRIIVPQLPYLQTLSSRLGHKVINVPSVPGGPDPIWRSTRRGCNRSKKCCGRSGENRDTQKLA